ncbi:MAG: hypothetical protein JWQ35_316 [Bacteriovoracaceae bacterium]|nr:hypothetical protein [Bacteriovoracaceae bacterium]
MDMNVFRIFALIALSLVSIWNRLEAASPQHDQPESNSFRRTDNLMVDPFPDKVAVTEKSEDGGIADMRGLLMTSSGEEAWFFVHGMNAWFQASTGQHNSDTTGSKMRAVSIKIEGAAALFKFTPEITLYHFHPISALQTEREITEGFTKKKLSVNPHIIKSTQAWQNIQLHMPSAYDFELQAKILNDLEVKGIQKKLNARIVMPLGILEYGLTEKGLRFVQAHSHEEIEKILEDRFLAIHVPKIKAGTSLVKANLRTTVSVIQECLKEIGGEEFTISFKPHSDVLTKMRPPLKRFANSFVSICKKILARLR